MKTYLEMNEKVADILQHGGKIEQYAAQYIEELRKENAELKHRAEVAERALKDCSKRLLVFTKSFGDGATEEEVYNKMIKIAEKELSEEEEDE